MPISHHRLQTAAALLLAAAVSAGGATAHAADAPPKEPPNAAPQDLSSTGADRTLYGIGAASRTGWAVAPAGDVNGDGIADAIIGAPGEAKAAGAAYVVFGRAGGSPLSALKDLGDGGFRIGGAAAGDQAGLAVSAAGDVNGDGLGDVAVGAPGATGAGRAGAGVVFVVFGKKATEPVSLGALGAGGYGIVGAAAGDAAGTALAALGDVGADGVPDLAVGAPTAAGGRKKGGAAYVVAGHKGGGDVDLAVAESGPSWRLNGPTGGFAGLALAAVPDLNGDGASELAIGAPATAPAAIDDAGIADVPEGDETRGAAYVVFGHGGTTAEDLPALPAERGWRLRGGAADAALGTSLAAGDLDGDGTADVAIGAPQSDEAGRKDSGSAYILFGAKGTGATVDLSAPGAARVLRIDGAAKGDALGAGVAVPGDLDADGKADLVVSSVFAAPFARADAGAAYRVGGPLAPARWTPRRSRRPRRSPARRRAATCARSRPAATSTATAPSTCCSASPRARRPPSCPTRAPSASCAALRPRWSRRPRPRPTRAPRKRSPRTAAGRRRASSSSSTTPARWRTPTRIACGPRPSSCCWPSPATRADVQRGAVRQLRRARLRPDQARLRRRRPAADQAAVGRAGARAGRRQRGHELQRRLQVHQQGQGGRRRADLPDRRRAQRGRLRQPPPRRAADLRARARPRRAPDGRGQRLARIARETKGTFFPSVTRDTIQAAMNAIAAKVNCGLGFDQFVDTLTDEDPEADTNVDRPGARHRVGRRRRDVGDPLDEIEPTGLVVVDGGKPVVALPATALRRAAAGQDVAVGGVHVTGRRGVTFVSLHVTGLEGADRLRVRVGAVSTHARGSVRVRTQVAQSRRRR